MVKEEYEFEIRLNLLYIIVQSVNVGLIIPDHTMSVTPHVTANEISDSSVTYLCFLTRVIIDIV